MYGWIYATFGNTYSLLLGVYWSLFYDVFCTAWLLCRSLSLTSSVIHSRDFVNTLELCLLVQELTLSVLLLQYAQLNVWWPLLAFLVLPITQVLPSSVSRLVWFQVVNSCEICVDCFRNWFLYYHCCFQFTDHSLPKFSVLLLLVGSASGQFIHPSTVFSYLSYTSQQSWLFILKALILKALLVRIRLNFSVFKTQTKER